MISLHSTQENGDKLSLWFLCWTLSGNKLFVFLLKSHFSSPQTDAFLKTKRKERFLPSKRGNRIYTWRESKNRRRRRMWIADWQLSPTSFCVTVAKALEASLYSTKKGEGAGGIGGGTKYSKFSNGSNVHKAFSPVRKIFTCSIHNSVIIINFLSDRHERSPFFILSEVW